jgi:hypothetical protein
MIRKTRRKIRSDKYSYKELESKEIPKVHNPLFLFNPNRHKKLFREGNISLILESYEDMFSDFDPRPFAEKALSDDFLSECKRAVRDKHNLNSLELRFLVPKKKRNVSDESTIRRRLIDHFEKHHAQKLQEYNRIKRKGIIWAIWGWIILFLSGIIYLQPGIFYQLLFVVFNPAGWFTMWRGFDLFFSSSKEVQDYEFYKKMTNLEIYYHSY